MSHLTHDSPWLLLVLLIVLGPAMPPATAQEIAPDDDDQLRTGLVGDYRDHAGHSFRRADPQIAFNWRGSPPDRRLSSGPYSVKWQGYLMSQARGEYRLSLYAAGKVKVTLAGEVVIDSRSDQPRWMHSEPIELSFDWHDFEIQYASLPDSGRINLFWSGPDFSLEPISPRQLFHEPAEAPASRFARGQQLVRGLRCAACHAIPGEPQPMAAPALVHAKQTLNADWLIDWLTAPAEASAEETSNNSTISRRMPHFEIAPDEARAITAYLLAESQAVAEPKKKIEKPKKAKPPEAIQGRRLVNSRGCLACHAVGELGNSGMFGGGDLSSVASKRPEDFFRRWLLEPGALNAEHRMPVYEFDYEELGHIAKYLQTLRGEVPDHRFAATSSEDSDLISRGKALVGQHQCAACHALPGDKPPAEQGRGGELVASSAWSQACSGELPAEDRPHYDLTAADRKAIESFISRLAPAEHEQPVTGEQLLVERNCLACHSRNGQQGLAKLLPAVGATDSKLNQLLPALQPPSLTSVGDKLTDQALHGAIRPEGKPHRPWLEVEMPRFRMNDSQEEAIVAHLIATDRLPAGHGLAVASTAPESEQALRLAGKRLVTSAGFGCTSCHAVGDIEPPKGPLDAKGPDLLLLGKRIRRPWYDRWVRNPARIVPRMEMPSVQLATPGVLHDNLDSQLAAVWEVLNLPDFRPPEPGPLRVVRQSGMPQRKERAVVLTDVLETEKNGKFIKPLLVGMPNRHNLLFDLEQARVAAWWIGDTAQQRTKGKTWFWTAGGENLIPQGKSRPEIQLIVNDETLEPQPVGQFLTQLQEWEHVDRQTFSFSYRLLFGDSEGESYTCQVREVWQPLDSTDDADVSGIQRTVTVSELPAGATIRMQVTPAASPQFGHAPTDQGQAIMWSGSTELIVHHQHFDPARPTEVDLRESDGSAELKLEYRTRLPVDRFPQEVPPVALPEPVKLASVPGFEATRLSLPTDVMPTGLAWGAEGELYLTSLKGRVWQGQPTEADPMRYQWHVVSDELAAPFGLAVGTDYVDVVNKYALLRLTDKDADGFAETTRILADGWGHTDDYHDWAVGLERDSQGNYYVAIPCEQDGRSLAAAHWRGKVLRIDPLRGKVEKLTGGHRFPIGIARNRAGELFVSDNQGNYNPFNELNHVIPGRRYGFLNSTERKIKDFEPELSPPAIDIPHPWTRSVNGICFLETPDSLREEGRGGRFGPFEGHLVGCEYDTRRLIRMSLDHVGGGIQGAAYPLSIVPKSRDEESFLGPISCAVAPTGELYIGNIRDSGWGGGNNIGSLVRMRFDEASLPVGIREVRAEPGKLLIEFTAELSATRLADAENYAISSYTRKSTPSYGGDDRDRRRESIESIQVSDDHRQVAIELETFRAGYVYEIRLSGLVEKGETLHPAEAFYTMRRVP